GCRARRVREDAARGDDRGSLDAGGGRRAPQPRLRRQVPGRAAAADGRPAGRGPARAVRGPPGQGRLRAEGAADLRRAYRDGRGGRGDPGRAVGALRGTLLLAGDPAAVPHVQPDEGGAVAAVGAVCEPVRRFSGAVGTPWAVEHELVRSWSAGWR